MISITSVELNAWVGSLLWPFLRIGSMLIAAPVFGARMVPRRIRLALALMLAWILSPLVYSDAALINPLSSTGVVVAAQQVLIGVAMGFTLQLTFSALIIAAQSMAMGMGLGFATVVDPQNGVQVPVIGQYYLTLGTLIFLALNGHLIMLQILIDSFQSLPVGPDGLTRDGLWAVAGWGGRMFAGAVLVALTAMTSMLLINLAFGVMSRAAPQLNIFGVGFPVMMGMGFIVILFSLAGLPTHMEDLLRDAFELMGMITAGVLNMAEKSAQERTEQATPKRLRDARKKGQVPRSRELNSLILLLAASGGMLLFGDSIMARMVLFMSRSFTYSRELIFQTSTMQAALGHAMLDMLAAFTPLLVVLFVAALTAPLALGGWLFNPGGLAPKWSKLNPAKGFGRMFSLRAPVEAFKAFGKFAVVAIAAGIMLVQLSGDILALSSEALHQGLAHSANIVGWFFLAVSSVLLLIAAIDVPFQLYDHSKKLKMSKQDVKDEQKQTEGSPDTRSRIRAVQRNMAQQRMMESVPTADVVVTNPTHYAVALRYDNQSHGAPVVVALGADLVAGHIRKVAAANDVPVVESPLLARALYFNTDIGQEIPAGLFVAVARLLAYVYQLKQVRDSGGEQPQLPDDLPVPDGLLKRH